ncbi:hypothetical protein JCM18237_02300 [Halorubrum luteum]
MSRFSEAERERIRSALVEAGRELFAQFGFDRTRISDITEAVDIGTSTFYQFFDSKEALYVEVLCVERDRLLAEIDEAVSEAESPREELRTMLETLLQEVRSNRLISRLIIDDEIRGIQERFAESDSAADDDHHRTELSYAKQWAELEEFRFDDPAVVRSMIRSLIFITRARDRSVAGPDQDVPYEAIEAAIVDVVVAGFFDDGSASS